MKNGLPVEAEMLGHDSKTCNINEPYWRYIITSMQEEGLIRGLTTEADQADCEHLENVQITPKGIEMLSDNGTAKKVDDLIKGILNVG